MGSGAREGGSYIDWSPLELRCRPGLAPSCMLARFVVALYLATHSFQWHPYGEFFASGSVDTNLKIWDIRRKTCIQTYKGHTRAVRQILFSPDGRWVVSGGDDGMVKLWDLTMGRWVLCLRCCMRLHGGHAHTYWKTHFLHCSRQIGARVLTAFGCDHGHCHASHRVPHGDRSSGPHSTLVGSRKLRASVLHAT